MSDLGHVFIHPWLSPDETWAGFYVDIAGNADCFQAILSRLAAHLQQESEEHSLPWFIPVLDPTRLSDASDLASKGVVLLLSSAVGDQASRDKVEAELRPGGIKLGLVLGPHEHLPATGSWDYVVLSASHARTLPPYCLIGLAIRTAIAVTGLRSRSDFTWAAVNQCSLVTSEYLLHRAAPGNKPDMLRMRLLKLLALIAEDADTCEMEEVFRQEPKLAYSLLRLVNAAALGPRQPITSFAQAITILGRQQLQRWLQLLIYADPNDQQHANPLLLLAATRGRLMEILVGAVRTEADPLPSSDAAFMAGTFSLLDVLLNLPMPEILVQLPLPGPVYAALEEHRGPLGKLLFALSAADNHDFDGASRLLDDLGIDCETFANAQIDALTWASSIRMSSD